MILHASALPLHIKKNLASLYILSGTDLYIQDQCAKTLIQAFFPECEIRKFALQQASDWEILLQEANSYSLFSEYTCLQASLDKKTLDATGKKTINTYLESPNPKCLILLQAPEMPAKQWQWLEKHEQAVILKIMPLEGSHFRNWIIQQLNHYNLRYEPSVVDILEQYTRGNQQACIQALEKLALACTPDTILSAKEAAEQIMDQSEWQIFDLAQACLQADAQKALTILRQAAETRIETTLVLWVLTQEIRLLSRLFFHTQSGMPFKDACTQLKVWNTRISAYQNMQKRLSASLCDSLMKACQKLDECIKTGKNQTVWQELEFIALALCLGRWR